MNKTIKEKIKRAVNSDDQKKLKNHTEFICPLRSWDIFAMFKENYKQKKR